MDCFKSLCVFSLQHLLRFEIRAKFAYGNPTAQNGVLVSLLASVMMSSLADSVSIQQLDTEARAFKQSACTNPGQVYYAFC